MAAKLKDFFDASLVRAIAADLAAAAASSNQRFDKRAFVAACVNGLDALELTGRGWHVADAMHAHLPPAFADAVAIVERSLGPELAGTEGFGMAPFRYLPHIYFVAKYGIDDFERSMHAQYELTKRFTAEFSIRAFIEKYPQQSFERLRQWARDPNVHVRRLVSEGTRPRLPWAPRLRALQADPTPVLELLALLADDTERYVQRSVANNLNDIAKDHAALVVDVCRRWNASETASPGRRWIVKHALRSLVKSGQRAALALLGVGREPSVTVGNPRLVPARVKLGKVLRFSFELTSTADDDQELLVDYAVHFVKADGTTRPKVFKLRRIVLPAGETLSLESTVSFETLTTRKAYPGRHSIDVLVNGVPYPLVAFDVVRPAR